MSGLTIVVIVGFIGMTVEMRSIFSAIQRSNALIGELKDRLGNQDTAVYSFDDIKKEIHDQFAWHAPAAGPFRFRDELFERLERIDLNISHIRWR